MTVPLSTPTHPKEIISSGVAAVSTTKHTVALMADGSVQTWGDNTSGQLGRSTTPSTTPGVVTGLGNDVVAVVAGYSFTLALKSDGSVWSMGSHEDGQLGNNITDGSMAQVSNLSGITAITAGTQSGRGFALALKNDGTVFSWGDNSFGQLGNGDATIISSNTPTLIAGLINVKAIAAGGAQALALKEDGTVLSWGRDNNGQLGDGAPGAVLTFEPTASQFTTPFINAHAAAITAGGSFSVALYTNGTIWSSGFNITGALGNGGTTNTSVPTQAVVAPLFTARQIAPSAGSNGTITSAVPIWVADGEMAVFTLAPDVGYEATVTGSCGGGLDAAGTTYTTAAVTADCTVDATFALKTYNVNLTHNTGGTVTPPTATQTVTHGSTLAFTIAPDAGYTATVTGCGGGLDAAGTTYTTAAIAGDCTVDVAFAATTYTMGVNVGTGGSAGSGAQTLPYGTATTIFITPDIGYDAVVTGCNGTLSGNIYTIASIMGHCTVDVQFVLKTFTVQATWSGNGSVSPSTQTISYGQKAYFTLMPYGNYIIDRATGCNGALSGQQYSTDTITGDCTVQAVFVQQTPSYTVNATSSGLGTISPKSQVVKQGAVTAFSVFPSTGYVATVTGCNGTLSGTTYTTGAINSACTVSATFKQQSFSVIAMAIGSGTISPTRVTTTYGSRITFSVRPYSGYRISTVTGCGGGVLSYNSYTVGPITSNCVVYANFVKK